MQRNIHGKNSWQAISVLIAVAVMILSIILFYISGDVTIDFSARVLMSLLFAVLSYTGILISMYLSSKRIDLFFLFVVLSFPFMYGRHVIYLLDMVPTGREAFRSVLSQNAYIKTTYYSVAAISAMYLGYTFIKKKKATITDIRNKKAKIDEKYARYLYHVCLILAIISIVPYIITSINDIKLTRLYGYGYRIVEGSANETGIITIIAGFLLPALIGMLISRKEKEWLSIVLIIMYFAIYTFTGSRINTFCYAVLFVYLYMYWGRRLKRKINFGKILLAALAVAFIFSIISSTRSLTHSMTVSQAVAESAMNIWKNNPFSSILYETGNTYTATAAVIEHCPNEVPHIYGMTYVCAFIYIIPNAFTGGLVNNYIFTDEAIAHYLTSYGGVGSSYTAEAYYNFGAVGGLVILIILGYMWGKLCSKTEKAILVGNPVKFFMCCQFFIAIVFMVRSDLVYRLRPFVWYTIPIIIITDLLYKRDKKRWAKRTL